MFDQINKLLFVPYKEFGRDLSGMDCWGLVRYVLQEQLNIPDLPEFGQIPKNSYKQMTHSYQILQPRFIESNPTHGAVACCFRGNIFFHVGICIDAGAELKILHTRSQTGPALSSITSYERLAPEVKYYQWRQSTSIQTS